MPAIVLPKGSAGKGAAGFSCARIINMIAESAQDGGRSGFLLKRWPGLKPFAAVTGFKGCRGLYTFGQKLYAVVGGGLYSVSETGAVELIGNIDGAAPVIMDDNGAQLKIVGGAYSYIFEPGQPLHRITSPGFLKSASTTYVDGRFYDVQEGTLTRFVSSLFDGKEYDPLAREKSQFLTGEIVRAIACGGNVWNFGVDRFEIDFSTGEGDFPFDVQPGTRTHNIGLGAKHSVALGVNSLFFLGHDGIVYATGGYSPRRISSRFIENEIAALPRTDDAEGMYITGGHSFYVLTFPEGKRTFAYDATEDAWTEIESAGQPFWRARGHARAYGRHFVGDRETGKIFEMDMDTLTEDGAEVARTVITHPVFGEDTAAAHGALAVLCSVDGQQRLARPGMSGTLGMSYSHDGGRTWTPERHKTLGIESLCAVFDGLGDAPFAGRTYRLRMTGSCDWSLHGAALLNTLPRSA